MANVQIGNVNGVVDKRQVAGSSTNPLAEFANTKDVTALRARLTALNAGYYTAARLDGMLENDMVYALRLNSADVAGI